MQFVSIVSSSFSLSRIFELFKIVVRLLACVNCTFSPSWLLAFFFLFSLFRILAGCLDWFRLCLVVVQWLRLCYAISADFDQLVFNLFQVASSSSS